MMECIGVCRDDLDVIECAGCPNFQYALDNGFYEPDDEDEQRLKMMIATLNRQLVAVCEARSEEE